jgi:hypothetical protein
MFLHLSSKKPWRNKVNNDEKAFFAWMNEGMFSGDGVMTRKDFAAKTYMRLEDLKWAFCSGRTSVRLEQSKEGK